MNTVLITGGSRGIGEAMARLYADQGWRVAFTYLNSDEKAQSLSRESGALALRCDAKSEAETSVMAEQVLRQFGHLDALICNAGISYTGLLQDMTVSQWDELFAVHVRGAFLATRAFLPGMVSRQSGSILYVSSMWGQTGGSCETAYSAFKAGLIGFTKALSKECGPSGVRVNCVAPGLIDTDMNRGLDGGAKDEIVSATPLGRIGSPEDCAAAALFLCSPAASFITGQVLGVSGGFLV